MTNQENNHPAHNTQEGLPGNPFRNAAGSQQPASQPGQANPQTGQADQANPQTGQAASGPEQPGQGTPTFQPAGAPMPQGPQGPQAVQGPHMVQNPQASQGPAPAAPQLPSGANQAAGPYSNSAPAQAQTATATKKPRKTRKTLAAFVAVALLSAGVGGGSAIAANHYLNSSSSGFSTATTTQVTQASANSPDWTATAAAIKDAVVAIRVEGSNKQGQGSGVIIDAKGHIVTNNHVVSGAGQGAKLSVTIGDKTYSAKVVGTDPSTDLAVLKLENPPSNLTVASWGDSSKLKVGQPVMAVGNPLGLSDTVTTGIVSALNRPVTTQAVNDNNVDDTNFNSQRDSDVVVTSAIQTNAAINPGNSGGALVDSSGALVGITSSIASLASNGSSSGQSGNIGIGFAIPSTQVKSVVEQLIANGTVKHPQLGIRASNGTSGTQLGAKVEDVTQGSAAAQAGLQKGDLITAIDGTPVVGSESLVAQVRSYEVGKEVTLKVLRGSETLELKVTLGTAN
ncbi:S1C family serine protease [Arachnia propionica]|uniref:S1C family serine protease n=1 Tax=Arachnia propionica TaxID=1750 RepID=UPI000F6E3ED6|nr:trypsin-like peptidase domain-containing protein [Arachnia propionica]VEJ59521.1 Periplasmic serine endoprotease DegP precursor [Arachnia propionica]